VTACLTSHGTDCWRQVRDGRRRYRRPGVVAAGAGPVRDPRTGRRGPPGSRHRSSGQSDQPHITVIGVEPRTAADTAASLRAGHRVTLPAVPDTIADGLRHTSPARLPWEVNKVLLDDVVTVTDDDIAHAMRWAFDHLRIVAKLSGAAALAALARPGLPPGPAGVIISGGSVDYATDLTVA
jgi:threonine dehydratase